MKKTSIAKYLLISLCLSLPLFLLVGAITVATCSDAADYCPDILTLVFVVLGVPLAILIAVALLLRKIQYISRSSKLLIYSLIFLIPLLLTYVILVVIPQFS